MRQTTIPASFVRGGTSKALIFQRSDLPASEEDWTPILLAAMGSPDPHGRQLNGMGGGLSSLSKIAVVGPSSHPEADVDYTFVQVMVDRPAISMDGNCGNISSAIGPWAVDEGLVPALDGMTSVMIRPSLPDRKGLRNAARCRRTGGRDADRRRQSFRPDRRANYRTDGRGTGDMACRCTRCSAAARRATPDDRTAHGPGQRY